MSYGGHTSHVHLRETYSWLWTLVYVWVCACVVLTFKCPLSSSQCLSSPAISWALNCDLFPLISLLIPPPLPSPCPRLLLTTSPSPSSSDIRLGLPVKKNNKHYGRKDKIGKKCACWIILYVCERGEEGREREILPTYGCRSR